MTPEREEAVRRALEQAPASLRAIAREAGLSQALLTMIRSGDRSATPETLDALATALERLSRRHADAARLLRELQHDQGEG